MSAPKKRYFLLLSLLHSMKYEWFFFRRSGMCVHERNSIDLYLVSKILYYMCLGHVFQSKESRTNSVVKYCVLLLLLIWIAPFRLWIVRLSYMHNLHPTAKSLHMIPITFPFFFFKYGLAVALIRNFGGSITFFSENCYGNNFSGNKQQIREREKK